MTAEERQQEPGPEAAPMCPHVTAVLAQCRELTPAALDELAGILGYAPVSPYIAEPMPE